MTLLCVRVVNLIILSVYLDNVMLILIARYLTRVNIEFRKGQFFELKHHSNLLEVMSTDNIAQVKDCDFLHNGFPRLFASSANNLSCCFTYSSNIDCNADSQITSLTIQHTRGIFTTVPTWIAYLKHLETLILRNNSITESFPAKIIQSLGNLQTLDLSYNQLFGPVPSLGVLPNLQYV